MSITINNKVPLTDELGWKFKKQLRNAARMKDEQNAHITYCFANDLKTYIFLNAQVSEKMAHWRLGPIGKETSLKPETNLKPEISSREENESFNGNQELNDRG